MQTKSDYTLFVPSEPMDTSEEPTNKLLFNHHQPQSDISSSIMQNETNRLESFKCNEWRVNFLKPNTLAEAGFFCLKIQDFVQCAFCKGVLGNWKPGDNPSERHVLRYPNCSFMSGKIAKLCCKQQQQQQVVVCPYTEPRFKAFTSFEARCKSFNAWKGGLYSGKKYANAGFFFDANYVVCSYCGLKLPFEKIIRDPWRVHATYKPECPFVCLNKPDYIIESNLKALTSKPSGSKPRLQNNSSLHTKSKIDHHDERLTCAVCLNEDIQVLFLPCKHVMACTRCAPGLSSCPFCAEKITATTRIYLSPPPSSS